MKDRFLETAAPARSRHLFRELLLTLTLAAMLLLAPSDRAAGDEPATPPPITSAAEIDYPPFSIVTSDGAATGFSVELLRAALRAMGREVTFRIGPWDEVRSWLEQGQVQALPLVGRTPEREPLFDFTFPYMSLHGTIVIRQNEAGIHTLEDLRGRRVAVMRGDNAEEFLRREDRGIEIHTTDTFEAALRELSAGRHDAVVMQRLVALRLIQEMELERDLRVAGRPIETFRQDFCFAVAEGDSKTLALLNEGLSLVMADGTYRHLHAKWFAALELPVGRSIVVGGDHAYPPYEFLDENGRPAGYNVELTRAIAREMGLDIEIRLGPWAAMIEELQTGRIDALQGLFYSPERDLKFDFSQGHAVNHYVSVVRRDHGPPPDTFADLKNMRIVAQHGDFILEYLARQGLTENLNLVDDQAAVLREVAAGNFDCGLVVRVSALELMERHDWQDLRLGQQPLMTAEYCYAVPKGHSALLAQLSEGLQLLSESGEYRRIYQKWLGVYEEGVPDLGTILRYAALVVFPLAALILAVFFWSWSLRKQVGVRTEQLRRSEEQFRSLVEGAPDAIFVQTDQRFAYLNGIAVRLFGAKSSAELLGQPVMERFHPAVREKVRERIRLLNEAKLEVPALEEVYLRMDGSEVPVEVKAVPITYEGRNGALVFVRDITERKQAALALEKKQAMLERTEGIAHVGSWEWDIASDTVFWSDELFRIFQRDPAAGAPPYEKIAALFHPDDMPALRRAMAMAVTEARPFELEARILRPDQTLRRCLLRAHVESGADGRAVRLYGSLQDITEFKQAQERIEHLNNVLRAIRDVNQLIVRARNQENLISEGCRLLANSRGYSSALIVLTDGEDRPATWAEAGMGDGFGPLNKMLEGGELPPCCESARSAGGMALIQDHDGFCRRCPIRRLCSGTQAMCMQLRSDDEFFGYLAVAFDPGLVVDEEEQTLFAEMAGDIAFALRVLQMEEERSKMAREHASLQNQMIQAQKMEAVGRLAGGVAHDYNNILTVILGYTNLAMDKVPVDTPLYEDLQEILRAAERSRDITRQLLAFARRQTVAPEVLDLNVTVEGLLKMLRRLLGENIGLAWLPGADLWPVEMDPSQLDQILANLCVNARDAIADVGKITIETGNVVLDEQYCAVHTEAVPGRYVLLTVSDNGCGMDRTTLENIFEPFFTTKSVGQGTGLGLATVYGIARQNRGFVNVYSEPGQGTTFRIYLPRHAGQAPLTIPEELPAAPDGRGENVLLVEDDQSILVMTQQMLQRQGYTVLPAGTPGEALKLAEENKGRIHLLVSDVIMPEMNGRELARRLLESNPDLRIIFMSGYTADVIAHHGVLDKGVHFIQKPFTLHAIAAKVREVLDAAPTEGTLFPC